MEQIFQENKNFDEEQLNFLREKFLRCVSSLVEKRSNVVLFEENEKIEKIIQAVFFTHKDDYGYEFDYSHDKAITAAVAKAVIASISELDAKAIVVPTMGGHSARVMSNLKPEPLVIAICPNDKVARGLALNFGVYCSVVSVTDNFEKISKVAREEAIRILKLKKKDTIIITGGIHSETEVNQTNFLKIEEI
jgi:pyruvate kinase